MILNDNSTQQINTLVIQLQNRITNLSNELKSLNKEINNLDTEISDLKRMDNSQANDTAAMNAEIKANTKAISGKADKGHTHTKSDITDFPTSLKNPNALTINGQTYDGSTAVDAGVQKIENGGTGVATQAEINKAFIGNLDIDESDVTDGTEFVSSCASNNGFSEPGYVNTPYRRKFSSVWGYIKGKISSVLGLTKDSYGGKASTAGTADVAKEGLFGVLGGARMANSTNFNDLLNNELANGSGLMGGSILTKESSLGISAGWWNFLYIPHRTGAVGGNDNCQYGTLIVTSLDSNDGAFYIIHRKSGKNYTSHVFYSAT